jgi:hypothetical protein
MKIKHSKFKLKLKRLLPWTVRGYVDLIKDYNRAARSTKARERMQISTHGRVSLFLRS